MFEDPDDDTLTDALLSSDSNFLTATIAGTTLTLRRRWQRFFHAVGGHSDSGQIEFAHFANGSSITSDLVLMNVFVRPSRPRPYFYDRQGERIAAESMVEVVHGLEAAKHGGLTVRRELPLESLTISTRRQGELDAGNGVFTTLPVVPVEERQSQE